MFSLVSLKQSANDYLNQYWILLVTLAVGSSLVLIALFYFHATSPTRTKSLIKRTTLTNEHVSYQKGTILVDIEGAVVSPGVYWLPESSRIQDAIMKAGGFEQKSVDTNFVARELNLAAKVSDGQKIYIVHKGENRDNIPIQVLGSAGSQTTKIDINSASAAQLQSLSGIGPSTAQKIIANRPYHTLEELVSKKSISKTVLTKIQAEITLN